MSTTSLLRFSRSGGRATAAAARPRPGLRVRLAAGLALSTLAGCAGAGAPGRGTPSPATEAEWRALALPRPEPLGAAARVAIAGVELVGDLGWPGEATVAPEIGVEELVATGLLRRRDVVFVERRRFAEAARAEREGRPRPAGAPAAGVSPPADFLAAATWIRLGPGGARAEVRLTDPASGAVVAAERVPVEGPHDPVGVARAIVDGIARALDGIGRRPQWSDPLARAPGAPAAPPVPPWALAAYLRGLAAESVWDWEGARVGYARAAESPTFGEASAALARAARLRLGGTLGES